MMDGKEFVDRMARGDPGVFDDLMPQLQHVVLGACAALRIFDQGRLDIVQDVALTAFTEWRSYRQESALGTWIYAIARRRCIDVQRKRKVRAEDRTHDAQDEGAGGHVPDFRTVAEWPSLEQTLCVQQVIAALEAQPASAEQGPRMIEVIEWCALNDPSTEELARYLGTTQGAARQRKSYILKRIRELCLKFCGDERCVIGPAGK